MTHLPLMIRLLVVALLLTAAPATADEAMFELRFDRLNGPYEDLVAEVAPVQSGPVTIRLTSPQHRLELKSNALEMTRRGGGVHKVRGTVRFEGTGTLEAMLDFSGLPANLQDRVVFPDQVVSVEGDVRIEMAEQGYLLTVVRLPEFFALEIESALGAEIVTWCNRLALFVAGNAGCDDLDRALSHPRLPLPAEGASHLVRYEEFTPEEREQLDIYLAAF